jgi:hypothetical protein
MGTLMGNQALYRKEARMMSGKIATLGTGWLAHRRVHLYPDRIEHAGTSYPLAGAHAEVTEMASGLLGRKHTITVTITTDAGQFTWQATAAGTQARMLYRSATKFAANLNSAAVNAAA